MQQKIKAIGYGCMLALAAVLLVQAWSLLGEREALAAQEQEVVQGEGKQSLQLAAEGDFFAALRWLRRLEREGVCISELQAYQKAQGQTLGVELVVRLP